MLGLYWSRVSSIDSLTALSRSDQDSPDLIYNVKHCSPQTADRSGGMLSTVMPTREVNHKRWILFTRCLFEDDEQFAVQGLPHLTAHAKAGQARASLFLSRFSLPGRSHSSPSCD